MRRQVLASPAARVAPDGHLVIVGHHPGDLDSAMPCPPEPGLFSTADDLAADLPGRAWEVITRTARPCTDTIPDDAPVLIHDTVLTVRHTRRTPAPPTRKHDHEQGPRPADRPGHRCPAGIGRDKNRAADTLQQIGTPGRDPCEQPMRQDRPIDRDRRIRIMPSVRHDASAPITRHLVKPSPDQSGEPMPPRPPRSAGPKCRTRSQRKAWRILNRPNPMVPEIRIVGPPGRERRGTL
ncbi:hypothetical protein GCM10019016_126580 [Streptomyces prasinosporus]|uniref:Uncharacterized protein n=1 Tax=Streptomyces prasinosporus TaxID=68256 RepID=A0ABP6UEC6_9ACTN